MDLLPKSSISFSDEKYWDAFFTKRKDDPFEWYGEYKELSELLHKYISTKDALLVVGCGNSTLSLDLFASGIKNQTNIDISSVVISQMQSLYPQLTFQQQDVTALQFSDNSFSCVFDKGTYDALSPPPSKKTESDETDTKLKVDLMLEEISRVVRLGGRFICVSLLQPHVSKRLLTFFHSVGWMIRVTRCLPAEQKTLQNSKDGTSFPVFVVIFTKVALPAGMKPCIEASTNPQTNGSFMRFELLSDLLDHVKEQQNLALIKKGLRTIGFCAATTLSIQLSTPASLGTNRYEVHVVDVLKLAKNPPERQYGVFIVPQGRESEWMFGTHEGRLQLAAEETKFSRLAVVHLIRGQVYESMDKIQQEVGSAMSYFAPQITIDKNIKAPIMTLGNEIGDRLILLEATSEFSGNFVVEDVTCDGKTFRRLIFLNTPNVIQSEVEVCNVKKRGKEFRVPMLKALTCEHHNVMVHGFGLLKSFTNIPSSEQSSVSALLIGLGGGLLASFLVNFMPKLELTAVEIDSEIVKMAKNYFGLPTTNDRFRVVTDDGLKFIQSTESKYNVILIDVDNKSVKEGLSCPPPEFLSDSILQIMKSKLMPEGSLFILNLVCRNEELKKRYFCCVQQIFPFIYTYDVAGEVNVILFCFPNLPKSPSKSYPNLLKQAIQWKPTNISGNTKEKRSKDEPFDDTGLLVQNFKLLNVV